ncbi:MAG: phosphoadenosine phosphosulfate reductase family protein [Proteobacteria bacterium]|nr:phosphoadenosine phosphosulfate reductase family protein [Pseudomonadota bacterium]
MKKAINTETGSGAAAPDLTTYDWIVINSSAGKDSQAMLDEIVKLADEAGVDRSKLVVFHADLGRVEWDGTAELAERQAELYGLRFEKIARPQGDLLDHIEARGMFPSSAARYCTSDHKRGQAHKLLTKLVRELGLERQARVLNCMGLRREESPARAKKDAFTVDKRATNGRRHVDEWLPILEWLEGEVWARIHETGVPHHPAYDAGMPRLSCCFCVMASRSALVRAAQLVPELAAEYVALEERIGHTFQAKASMAEIVAEAEATTELIQIEGWAA